MQHFATTQTSTLLPLLSDLLLMAPKRGVGRGRVRRGRGGRTPCSGRGGRHGASPMLPLLPWRRASGVITFSCTFMVKTPLAFFFILLFPPLLLNMVWMVYFFVFRGAVGLLLMLIWRLTTLADLPWLWLEFVCSAFELARR